MVRVVGLEPTRNLIHQSLRLAWLATSPYARMSFPRDRTNCVLTPAALERVAYRSSKRASYTLPFLMLRYPWLGNLLLLDGLKASPHISRCFTAGPPCPSENSLKW